MRRMAADEGEGLVKESRRPDKVAGSPAWMDGYFFLPEAAFLSAMAWLFFAAEEEAAALFCEDFFWLSFGDRSPMDLSRFGVVCCARGMSVSPRAPYFCFRPKPM